MSRVRRWTSRLSGFALLCALAACGAPGDRPRAGWTTYEPPGKEYRMRYLSPPWERGSASGASLTLRVKSNAERFVPDAAGGVPPKYRLMMTLEGGSAEQRIAQARQAVTAAGESLVVPPRSVTTDHGDAGFELLSDFLEIGMGVKHRIVYLNRRAGGVVALDFEGTAALDEPQVDLMVRGVEVDPDS